MDRDELIAFLRENLRVSVEVSPEPFSDSHRVRVALMLGDEVIDASYDTVPTGDA